jgi:two-component system, NtrC family, response regulator AtoC
VVTRSTDAEGPPGLQTPIHPLGIRASEHSDLLLAVGNGQFLSHQLTGRDVVIGREPGCDFVIDHPSLSRRHAQVQLGQAPTVQDLGSTNGTRVAGRTLRGGDPVGLTGTGSFEIGPFTFLLVARRAGSAASLSGGELLRITDPTLAGIPPVVREFASSDASILITGETGVGKDVLAASLHELSGRTGPLIQVNCAALNEALLESELFGYERGAFTGAVAQKAGLVEAAAGGTLFLDEIGELPLAIQAKLLRVIERREVMRLGATRTIAIDLRFLAATNRDLAAEVARGAFRSDLLYRLDGVTLWIAPLRDRRGAIVPLALQFLAAVNARRGRATGLSSDAAQALAHHTWPGNVRELKAVIERAAVLAGSGDIAVRHLTFTARAGAPAPPPRPAPELAPTGDPADPMSFLDAAQRADRARIVEALDACAGNQTRAAKQLGISRTTLVTRLRIYKIPGPSGGRR